MILLAQMDSGDLSGFMQQQFVGPALGLVCTMGILLIVVVAALIYVRRRRAQANRRSHLSDPSPDSLGHEMPDLDLLVNTTGLERPAPAASPSTPTRTSRKGTFLVAVNDGDPTEAVEVMTILRDVVDGGLIVQMGDKAYQSLNTDRDFQERFNKVMHELGQIVSKPSASPVQTASVPAEIVETQSEAPSPVAETPAPSAEPEAVAPALADLMQPPPATPPPPPTGTMPGDLPSFKLDDNPYERPKRGQKKEVKPVPEVNIAEAIEAYLQYRLSHTPEYVGRSIHIYPAPDGGVSIEVDGRFYDAVGDIQETDVREFIATAIQEWQERH